MALWNDQSPSGSIEEIMQLQEENRAWSKELRLKSNALINGCLAKQISQQDYVVFRKISQTDAAECRRRAAVLDVCIAEYFKIHPISAAQETAGRGSRLHGGRITAILEEPRL